MSMNLSEDRGAADGSDEPAESRTTAPTAEDELAARITSALRARAAAAPDAAVVAARLEARLAEMPERSALATATRRGGKVVAAGLVTSALAVAGAGAAAAADPYSDVARTVESVARAVGIEWSPMPDGYTREQYDAFWGAGYTEDDVAALGALWQTDAIETKSRAGQLLVDGQAVPVAPSGESGPVTPQVPVDPQQAELDAYFDAGYDWADAEALGELWDLDTSESKVRAGSLLLDGEQLPFAPGEADVDG